MKKPRQGTNKQRQVQNADEPSTSHSSVVQRSAFSGPLPPPSLLSGYEQVVPGAVERILAMAEANSQHQRDIEFAALRATEREVIHGQIFGFTIGITALATSIIALWLGSQTVAGIIGGATVVGLVSAFIIGRIIKPEG